MKSAFMFLTCILSPSLLPLPVAAAAETPPSGATFLRADSPENTLIRIDAHKTIRRYPSATRSIEMNLMTVNGRSPANPDRFLYDNTVHFMVYVTRGKGVFYVDDASYETSVGDVLDVPPKTRFAVYGEGLEYVTVESPAFFADQAYTVDSHGKIAN